MNKEFIDGPLEDDSETTRELALAIATGLIACAGQQIENPSLREDYRLSTLVESPDSKLGYALALDQSQFTTTESGEHMIHIEAQYYTVDRDDYRIINQSPIVLEIRGEENHEESVQAIEQSSDRDDLLRVAAMLMKCGLRLHSEQDKKPGNDKHVLRALAEMSLDELASQESSQPRYVDSDRLSEDETQTLLNAITLCVEKHSEKISNDLHEFQLRLIENSRTAVIEVIRYDNTAMIKYAQCNSRGEFKAVKYVHDPEEDKLFCLDEGNAENTMFPDIIHVLQNATPIKESTAEIFFEDAARYMNDAFIEEREKPSYRTGRNIPADFIEY